MQPYTFEEIATLKEGEVEATLHLATLIRVRHPVTRDHLKVCLVNTQTAQLEKNMSHVESLDKILTRVNKDIDAHIIVAPEYSYYPDSRPLTEQEKDYFLHKQKDNTKGKLVIPGTFVWQKEGCMYNEAYFISNGDIIGQYLKCKDGGEWIAATKFQLKYIQGKEPGIFEWNKLKLGIEICIDMGTIAAKGIGDRDLLFAISCGRQDIDTRCLRNGGYGFVNDGYQEFVFIAYKQLL